MHNTSKSPKEYYNELLEIILKDSYYASLLDQDDFPEDGDIESYEDVYEVMDKVILVLRSKGDLHSRFKRPKDKNKSKATHNESPVIKIINGCGYIGISSFVGQDKQEILDYGKTLQKSISKLEGEGVKGYIVDLQGNGGGNMFPMLLGLGPLIERNPTAFFRFADGSKHSWGYEDGDLYYNDEIDSQLSNPLVLSEIPRIALLVDGGTASSAEMVVVSMMGDYVRVFGSETKNRTTGNAIYRFEDGSKLVLATSMLEDLEGNSYVRGITPDEICDAEEVIDKACGWIVG